MRGWASRSWPGQIRAVICGAFVIISVVVREELVDKKDRTTLRRILKETVAQLGITAVPIE